MNPKPILAAHGYASRLLSSSPGATCGESPRWDNLVAASLAALTARIEAFKQGFGSKKPSL